MDISSIRLNNLLALMRRYKKQVEFAEAVDTAPAYIIQVLGGKKRRTEDARKIGNDFARKIETKLKLPYGWMDQTHDTDGNTNSVGSAKSPGGNVPLLLWSQAGALLDLDMKENKEWINTSGSHSPRAFALTVDGDSNAPDFPAGTIVVVDPDVEAKPGHFVVAKLGEVRTMRELVKDGTEYALKPVNPAIRFTRLAAAKSSALSARQYRSGVWYKTFS